MRHDTKTGLENGNNNSNTGACTLSCKLPACGDTFVQPPEQCDDGNASDTDACVAGCKNASCGDGKVWQGNEQCDDGMSNGMPYYCNATCTGPTAWCGRPSSSGCWRTGRAASPSSCAASSPPASASATRPWC